MCILKVVFDQNLLIGTEGNHEKLVTVVGRSRLAVEKNSRVRQMC